MAIVYLLLDPRDGAGRYVGITSRSAARRLQSHLAVTRAGGRTHVHAWVSSLLAAGLVPEIEVLETHATLDSAAATEDFWIGYCRYLGMDLTNLKSGGPHARYSTESRAKMSVSAKKRGANHGWTPDARARVGIANRARVVSATTRAKNGAAHRNPSLATRAKMSASQRLRYARARAAA